MVEIYNEIAYIHTVLEKGLGVRWRRDLTLLIKYWKSYPPHYKKKDVMEMALNKCAQYVPDFNPITQKGEVYKIVENTWKNWKYNIKKPEKNSHLRNITDIKITQEVLDWFADLPNSVVLTDEELAKCRDMRRHLRINSHPINAARARMLFTLYIWSLIQSTYIDEEERYTYFVFDSIKDKLKEDAKLGTSFNIREERDFLKDLGFISLSEKDVNIWISVKNKSDVFNIPMTLENTVSIPEADLYRIGEWFNERINSKHQKIRECSDCGIELPPTKSERGRPAKYCSACARKRKKAKEEKFCIDCGAKLVISPIVQRRSSRCPDCADMRKRQLSVARVQKYNRKQNQSEIKEADGFESVKVNSESVKVNSESKFESEFESEPESESKINALVENK